VDVRIVCATHRDLEKRIADGAFREDLFYRLNVIQVHIPPLRERGNDIALLAQHFLAKYADANGKDVRKISDDALARLLRHPWPGNVRELENAIERAVVLADGPTLTEGHFPTLRRAEAVAPSASARGRAPIPGSTLADIERDAILRTLEAVDGSTARAAAMLDISPRKIQYKLKEYHHPGAPALEPAEQEQE
jgi:DNA-binding NtrC family response regulator